MLAGGRGNRLGGKNKSLIEVDGITILQRNLDILRPLFSEILLSGWPDDTELPAGIRKVPDNFPGKGPLAGIEASMKAATTPYIFVFGGDMPWLSEEIIKSQVADFFEEPTEVPVPRIEEPTEVSVPRIKEPAEVLVPHITAPADVLVPRINYLTEPLHAIYSCGLHSSLEAFLRSGERPAVIDFIRLSKVRYYDLSSSEETMKAFTNINTPEDLHG